jgi:aminoacrylate peracid reductase
MPTFDMIDPGWSYSQRYTFSPAVRKGNWLFISGLTATDERGTMVGKGDIVAQTRQIFEKIQTILEAAGGSFDDIVKTVDYIVTTEGYKGTADVRREYFRNLPPLYAAGEGVASSTHHLPRFLLPSRKKVTMRGQDETWQRRPNILKIFRSAKHFRSLQRR